MTGVDRGRWLDEDDYYRTVYLSIRATLDEFASSVRLLRTDPRHERGARTLLDTSSRLLADACRVCGAVPPGPAASTAGFAADLDRFRAVLRGHRDDPSAVACERELAVHADYLARLQETWDSTTPAEVRAPAERDFLVNAVSVVSTLFERYRWRSADPRAATSFFDATKAEAAVSVYAKELIRQAAEDLLGWCSDAKAIMLHALVRDLKPDRAVEIGVFGGRSLIPIAAALKENRSGEVIGIETWSAGAIAQFQTSITNDLVWAITDYAKIKGSFLRFVVDHGLHDVIRIVEAPSNRAHLLVEEIGLLHIDGGHSAFGAAQDIVNYVPKVNAGGLIVFDDIDWGTTMPALELLMDTCRLLHVVATISNSTVPGCSVFQKL